MAPLNRSMLNNNVIHEICYFNELSKKAMYAQEEGLKKKKISGYPRVFEIDSEINKEIRDHMKSQTTEEFVRTLDV